tara:strand:+ start:1097 stop:1663 length:567 start_codon:yes stop_codon:yes gene_type:complete
MKTIAQQLKIKDFPFIINGKNGNIIYYEDSDGLWWKSEYDADGKEIRFESSDGLWWKSEYDDNGKEIYRETSKGIIKDKRPKTVEPTNSESIEAWEIKITSLVEDYKKLTACCDAASDAGALDACGKLYTAIWNTYDNMLQHIDVDGWISWYIFDNDCGAKEMEAGYSDELNTIKTPLDLARLLWLIK